MKKVVEKEVTSHFDAFHIPFPLPHTLTASELAIVCTFPMSIMAVYGVWPEKSMEAIKIKMRIKMIIKMIMRIKMIM